MSNLNRAIEFASKHYMATGIAVLLALLAGIAAIIPENPASREREIRQELADGKVAEVASAPDGAKIWAVRREGRTIYFSKGAMVMEQIEQP
jgi:hypothetical protein